MILLPPLSTRTATLCPYPTLFRSGSARRPRPVLHPTRRRAGRGCACPRGRVQVRASRRQPPLPVAVPTPAQRAPAREHAETATNGGGEDGPWSRRVPVDDGVTQFRCGAAKPAQIGRAHV